MQIEQFKREVSDLLQKDKVEYALELILVHIKEHEIQRVATIQSAGLTRIMNAYNEDLFDWDGMSIRRNRIIDKLLRILKTAEEIYKNEELLAEEQSTKSMFPSPEEIALSNQLDQQYLALGGSFDQLEELLVLKSD